MITILSIFLVIFTIISLLTNIFVLKSHKYLLYFLIPIQLFIATFAYLTIEGIKGYATYDISELYTEFTYVTHFATGENVYIIGIPENSNIPRMYAVDPETEKQIENAQKMVTQLNAIKEKTEQGNSVKVTISPTNDIRWKIEHQSDLIKKEQ